MTVRVLYFGVLADRIGKREVVFSVAADATVAALLDALASTYEDVKVMCDKLAVAVNLEYVKADCVLKDGDEVAIIPPVSGG